MAWFKCSTELLNRPEFVRISQPMSKGDSNAGSRFACIVKMLCQSAEGQFYRDVSHFMAMTGVSIKQAEQVWNELKYEGVLRIERGMYSASSWMIENGFMSKEKDTKLRPITNNRRHENTEKTEKQKDEKIVDGEAAERYKAELLRIVGSK